MEHEPSASLMALFCFSDSLVKSAVGLKKYRGIKYQTTAQSISGLIPAGSSGVNHGEWVYLNHTLADLAHWATG